MGKWEAETSSSPSLKSSVRKLGFYLKGSEWRWGKYWYALKTFEQGSDLSVRIKKVDLLQIISRFRTQDGN
jgi:hypothetical protein